MEYYFSDVNLATTDHLMRFINKDPEGFGNILCYFILVLAFHHIVRIACLKAPYILDLLSTIIHAPQEVLCLSAIAITQINSNYTHLFFPPFFWVKLLIAG